MGLISSYTVQSNITTISSYRPTSFSRKIVECQYGSKSNDNRRFVVFLENKHVGSNKPIAKTLRQTTKTICYKSGWNLNGNPLIHHVTESQQYRRSGLGTRDISAISSGCVTSQRFLDQGRWSRHRRRSDNIHHRPDTVVWKLVNHEQQTQK